jgi:proteasome lid subunit RPN8/RPN11
MRARVVAGPEVLAEIGRLAGRAYPAEGCGVLVGTATGELIRIVVALPGRNLRSDRARDRYELDPADIVRAERTARADRADVVGFWHSHPDHPARPSAFDTERAWTDYVYVIASTTASGTVDVRAWQLDAEGGAFAELPIATEAPVPADPR